MVFISFPANTTSDEENLLKKYEKLDKKKKSLEQASKPEPQVISKDLEKPLEAKDAKKVIEKLKQKGALPQIINSGKKQEFKRKLPANGVPKKQPKIQIDEARQEVVSYEDDLFS